VPAVAATWRFTTITSRRPLAQAKATTLLLWASEMPGFGRGEFQIPSPSFLPGDAAVRKKYGETVSGFIRRRPLETLLFCRSSESNRAATIRCAIIAANATGGIVKRADRNTFCNKKCFRWMQERAAVSSVSNHSATLSF
jgi:hypothetical protein